MIRRDLFRESLYKIQVASIYIYIYTVINNVVIVSYVKRTFVRRGKFSLKHRRFDLFPAWNVDGNPNRHYARLQPNSTTLIFEKWRRRSSKNIYTVGSKKKTRCKVRAGYPYTQCRAARLLLYTNRKNWHE